MIVKKPTLANGAVAWRPNSSSVPGLRVVSAEQSADVHAIVRKSEDRPPVAPVVIDPPREWTTAEVIDWLALQSDDDRKAVAAELANGIAGLEKAAQESGKAAGLEAGRRLAARESERLLALLSTTAAECQGALERELQTMGECTVVVLEEVLRKISGPLLGSREAVVGAVNEVIGRLTHEREIRIRVAASDLPVLSEMRAQLASTLGDRRYDLVADERVTTGGCIVDSSLGSLDGRLELQLHELLELIAAEKRALASP